MRSASGLVAALVFVLPAAGLAEPGVPPPSWTPAPAPATAPSIESLARGIVLGLGRLPPDARIVGAPLVADGDAPRRDALVLRVLTQIATTARTNAPESRLLSLAEARAAVAKAPLVHVSLEIVKGELRAAADLHPPIDNAWDRLRGRVPAPSAHAFAKAPLDAEIRSYMTPIVLEKAALHRAKHDETDVLAIGCGDLDGDGGLELVLVSRTRLSLGQVRGDRFVARKTMPWTAVAPRSAVPLREPIASVLVSPPSSPGEIWLGSTDRSSVVLDAELATKRALPGLPFPGGGCAPPLPEWNALDGSLLDCTSKPGTTPRPFGALPEARVDAASVVDVRLAGDRSERLAVARSPGGKLSVGPHGGPAAATRSFDGIGADVVTSDLDLDGRLEIAFSAERGDEAITVATLTASGLEPRMTFPAPEPVRALAACPPEERGVPALVAVVGSEVWIVR